MTEMEKKVARFAVFMLLVLGFLMIFKLSYDFGKVLFQQEEKSITRIRGVR